MTLGTSAMNASLPVHSESDSPPGRCTLRGGQIQTEMRNTPQSLRSKVLGCDLELRSGVLGPAAPLLPRGVTPKGSRQVKVQLGDRDFQGSRDGEQALGRHVLEAPLELGEIRGRQLGGLCQLAQGPLRFFSAPAK